MNHRTFVLTLVAALAWSGCDSGEDVDAGRDAGPRSDAGPGDAGPPPEDAGPGDDAGMDAGPMVDGGADAGMDAGPPPVTPSAAGDIVITEISPDNVGYAFAPLCDSGLVDWWELHNPSTTTTYNLNGCTVADRASRIAPDNEGAGLHTIVGDLILAPGAYIVVAASALTVATHGFDSDYSYNDAFGISGAGEDPTIKCGGVTIDTVNFAAVDYPVPETMAGTSIQLDPLSLDATANDVGTNWCFSTTFLHRSPGADATCPAEPATDHFGTPRMANVDCTP